jgi:hypothetical protein
MHVRSTQTHNFTTVNVPALSRADVALRWQLHLDPAAPVDTTEPYRHQKDYYDALARVGSVVVRSVC